MHAVSFIYSSTVLLESLLPGKLQGYYSEKKLIMFYFQRAYNLLKNTGKNQLLTSYSHCIIINWGKYSKKKKTGFYEDI